MKRNSILAVLALVGLMAVAVSPGAAADGEGKNQCWRYSWDPPTACTVCGEACRGTGYRCCDIVPDEPPAPGA